VSAVGALVGAVAAGGALLVASGVRARRPATVSERIAPYLAGSARATADGSGSSTVERLLGPSVRAARTSLGELVGGSEAIEERLARAGLEALGTSAYRLQQLTWAVVALLVSAVALIVMGTAGRQGSASASTLLLVTAAISGGLLRDRSLSRAIARRREAIRTGLPAVADLLALAVGSGESPVAALDRVGRVARGPLAIELRRACDDTAAGVPLVEALDAMARRVEVLSVRRFVDGVAIAVQRGTPLADVLRAQAGDARADLHRLLLETAARKELQMLIPVVFLVLPTVVLVALYPALSSLTSLSP
jgi:tight adherence protein C